MPLQVVLQYKEIAFLKFHLLILTFCQPILEKQMQDVLVSWVLVKQGAFGEQLPIKHNDLFLWFIINTGLTFIHGDVKVNNVLYYVKLH